MSYHIDYETYSEADLKKVGAARYAADPSTQILIIGVCKDDGPVLMFCPYNPEFDDEGGEDLFFEALASSDPVFAHNALFEAFVSEYCVHKFLETEDLLTAEKQGIIGDLFNRWICTQCMCRRLAIPESLDKASEYLKLEYRKDKRGSALIQKFSKPNRKGERVLPEDNPEDFREFVEYCRQDVIVERDIHRVIGVLSQIDPDKPHELSLAGYRFDLKMNRRGVPVNLDALERSQRVMDDYYSKASGSFTDITGLNPTQKEKVREWLVSRGVDIRDMQGSTIESCIENTQYIDPKALAAMILYRELSFTAPKKVTKMLELQIDGRLKGLFAWSGAQRTHRWAGRLVQLQNLRKPTIPCPDSAYDLIRLDEFIRQEDLGIVWGSLLEVIASLVRNFIEPEGGKPLLQADYAAIEARVVAWLAGQDDLVRKFANEEPIYEDMASVIYNTPLPMVTKNQRAVGKVAVLGAGFGMGTVKFIQTCADWGVTLEDDIKDSVIPAYRAKNDRIVAFWGIVEDAARQAITNPGKYYSAGRHVKFIRYKKSDVLDFLFCVLPSGHRLSYPKPKIEKRMKTFPGGKKREVEEITFFGKQAGRVAYTRVSTYGGKLTENITQAVAGDIMTNGAVKAEERGFEVCMLVHDEAVAENPMELPMGGYTNALCDLPDWAEGLPIDAEGQTMEYYRK